MGKFRTSIVTKVVLFLICGAAYSPQASAQQVFSLQSEFLQETREAIVHLPENYDPNSKAGYPVFYVLDPDFPEDLANQPDDLTAETARRYHMENIMSEAIVVGIRNTNRSMDFFPHYYSVSRDGKQVFGNGGKLLAFIKNELIPFTDGNYRTSDQRIFIGHSWAGQFLIYTLSQSPETFDAYVITSPDITPYADETFTNLKRTFKQDMDFPAFIYASVGGDEESNITNDYEMFTALLKQNLPKEIKLLHEVNEGLTHDNNAQASIPRALKAYFSTSLADR